MDGYERVTELQEISQRSAGATAAQAEVYLEGLEASLNNIRVAWESIVQSVANSEIIMGILNMVAKATKGVAEMLDNTGLLWTVLTGIGVVLASNLALRKLETIELKKQAALEAEKTAENKKQGALSAGGFFKKTSNKVGNFFGKLASNTKLTKAIKGVGTGAAVGVALFSIGSMIKGLIDFRSATEKAVDEMKKLSNEAYRASQKSYELANTTSKFEELDNKIIKTKEDLKEMNSLMDAAAEKLSEEEKKHFDSLSSVQAKNAYLKEIQEKAREESKNKNNQIISNFINSKNRSELKQNPEYADALFAATKGKLYDSLDTLGLKGEERENANALVTMLADSLNIDQVEELLTKEGSIDNVIQQIAGQSGAMSILNSDNANFTEKIKALRELQLALGENTAAAKALGTAFNDLQKLSEAFHDNPIVLDWMNEIGMSTVELNKLNDSFKSFAHEEVGMQISQEEYTKQLTTKFLPAVANGISVQQAFIDTFGKFFDENGDINKGIDLMLNQFQTITGKNILDAGQSIDAFKNSIDSFYETASKWNEMSETEKTSFISSHQDLFKGKQGQELLKALENGNYAMIEAALGSNEALEKKREETLKWVEETLELEKQKSDEARDDAYIAQLEQYKKFLTDKDRLFEASLKTQLDQQNKQIDMYKDYLSKQKEEQEKSLNERKDAYQKYWADLDDIEKAEEYDEKRKQLEENLAKMGSTSGFETAAKRKELETELTNLQKDRAKELRQEARDSIVENIDNEISKIGESFDKLLNNQQALLMLLNNELKNPDAFFGKLAKQAQKSGATGLQLADYYGQIKNAYGSSVQNYDWSNKMSNSNNSYVINFNGQAITANSGIGSEILNGLKKIGGIA